MKFIKNIFNTHELIIFLLCFTVCAYFYSNGGWNQISRLDAVQAFVENESPDFGTFRIDRFVIAPDKNFNTGDWAYYNGHYYSNKAPGTILFGIPFHALLYYTEKYIYPCAISPYMEIFNAYMLNLFVSVFWVALGAVFFRKILIMTGASEIKASFFSLALILCTPLFPYSTQLWGHASSAAFVIFSLYNLMKAERKNIFLSGLFIGIAVLFEYLSGIFAVVLGIYILFCNRRHILYYIAGGIAPAIIFAAYHYMCFGSPLTMAATLSNPVFMEKEKMGNMFGNISIYVVFQLLISLKKGLLASSPLLIFAIPPIIAVFRKNNKHLKITILSLSCIILTLLVNSSFNGWHGGQCIFPRYLIISLPFWILLAALFDYSTPLRALSLLLLGGISFMNMLVAAALSPNCAYDVFNPLYSVCYERFLNGKFTTSIFFMKLHALLPDAREIAQYCSFNLGTLTGLKGLYSILPVLVIILLWLLLFDKTSSLQKTIEEKFRKWELHSIFKKDIKTDFFYGSLFSAVVMLTLLFPGNSVWINDEPSLLDFAFKASLAEDFGTHGLGGTVGITYGPVAVWLYQIFLMLTQDIICMVFFKTLLFLAIIIWSCKTLAREFSFNWKLGVIIFSASPYVYFYSRLLWDNVFLIPLSFLIAVYLMKFLKERNFISLLICALLNICCFYLHPMAMPLIFACVLTLMLSEYSFFLKHYLKCFTVLGLSLLAVLPNILNILNNFKVDAKKSTSLFSAFKDSLSGFQNLSFYGFSDYFFPELFETQLIPAVLLNLLICFGFLTIIFFFFSGTYFYIRKIFSTLKNKLTLSLEEKMALFAFLAIGINLIMNLTLCQLIHPHYFNAVLFAMFFIVWKGASEAWLLLSKIYCVIIVLLLAFLIFVIDINGGNRGLHHGATIENQLNVARTIIDYSKKYSQTRADIDVVNYKCFPHSLDLLVRFLQATELKKENRQQPSSEPLELIIRYSGNPPSGLIEAVPKK